MISKKNKKAFVFGIIGIVYIVLLIALVVLLVVFAIRISDGIKTFADFLRDYWWAIALSISAILWHTEIANLVRFILSKFGIKI